jgi:vacuolar-type H+-ATPase subunit I/STV1
MLAAVQHGPKPKEKPVKFRYILAASLLALAPAAFAQQAAPAAPNTASQIPASDKQAIQTYTLTDDVFNRIVKVSQEAKKQGIEPKNAQTDFSKIHSLDDLAKQITDSDPRIEPLIKANGFTPREFLLANLAVTNAAIASEAKKNPQMAQYVDQSKVNQKNVAFYEAHKDKINALMAEDQGGQ